MKIGVIGVGNVGKTIATYLVRAGHEVWVANGKDPDTLDKVIMEVGRGARAATNADAVRFAEVVRDLVRPLGQAGGSNPGIWVVLRQSGDRCHEPVRALPRHG